MHLIGIIMSKMTVKDKENFRMLFEGKFPGNRAYNRIIKAAQEGWLEIDESNPKMKKLNDGVRKLADKIWAEKGPELNKAGMFRKEKYLK